MSSSPHLNKLIVELFNQEELDELCRDLGIDPEMVASRELPKQRRVADLIGYVERRGGMTSLLAQLRVLRPKQEWPDVAEGLSLSASNSMKGPRRIIGGVAVLGLAIAAIVVAPQMLTPEIRCRLQLETCTAALAAAVVPSPQVSTDTPLVPTSAPTLEPTDVPATSTSVPVVATVSLESPQMSATESVSIEATAAAPAPTSGPLGLRVGCEAVVVQADADSTKIPIYDTANNKAASAYASIGESLRIIKIPAGGKVVQVRIESGNVGYIEVRFIEPSSCL